MEVYHLRLRAKHERRQPCHKETDVPALKIHLVKKQRNVCCNEESLIGSQQQFA